MVLPNNAFDKYQDKHLHAKCKNCEKAEEDRKKKETKKCTGCEVDLPIYAFDKYQKDLHSKCRDCEKADASKKNTETK